MAYNLILLLQNILLWPSLSLSWIDRTCASWDSFDEEAKSKQNQ